MRIWSGHRVGHRPDLSMTADEATKILAAFDRGLLDASSPETIALVGQARKVLLEVHLWGSTRHDPRRRTLRWSIAAGAAIVVITITGLVLVFLTSR